MGVAPIVRDRNGTLRHLLTEEFRLTEEEKFLIVDQPLELVARYDNYETVVMEASVSAVPEPNAALLFGMSSLLLVAGKTRSRRSDHILRASHYRCDRPH